MLNPLTTGKKGDKIPLYFMGRTVPMGIQTVSNHNQFAFTYYYFMTCKGIG